MSDNRAWSWRHAILKSDLPATTRHVLLTISCFMNDVGGGCYPTQEQLAEASGLSDRAVRAHIETAVKAGWLVRKEHGFRGQKWRNHEYEAAWPAQDVEAGRQHIEKGAEPVSGPFGEGAEPPSGKVRNDVPTILPSTSPRRKEDTNVSSKSAAIDQAFEAFWRAYPRRVSKGAARKAYGKAIRKISHGELMAATRRYAVTVAGKDPQFIPHPATWLNGERWSDGAEVADIATQDDQWARREAEIYASLR